MKTKKIPTRICVGCGEAKEKRSMIRILKTSEGNVCLDSTGKQNGRGAYLCKDTECLNRAIKTKGLERSLKMKLPDELLETLKKEMGTIETG